MSLFGRLTQIGNPSTIRPRGVRRQRGLPQIELSPKTMSEHHPSDLVRCARSLVYFLVVILAGLTCVEADEIDIGSHQRITNLSGIGSGDDFGISVAVIGDVDGNGSDDLAVGVPYYGGEGAVYILFLDASGNIINDRLLSDSTSSGSLGNLDGGEAFGSSVAGLGDIGNDGRVEIAVGSTYWGSARGRVRILSLQTDGKVHSTRSDFSPGSSEHNGEFGHSLACVGDCDGNGVPELAIGARRDESAGDQDTGAVYIYGLNSNAQPTGHVRIANGEGGLTNILADEDNFGFSLAYLGDVAGIGTRTLAVGATRTDGPGNHAGSVFLLSLDNSSQVTGHTQIDDADLTAAGGPGLGGGEFGSAIAALPDLDGDGAIELAVGEHFADNERGRIHLLSLDASGNVRQVTTFDDSHPELFRLDADERFGRALAVAGDFDSDGIPELLVGAPEDRNEGSVFTLFLDPLLTFIEVSGDGTVIADGDTTPAVADGTFLGTVAVGAGFPETSTFTIENTSAEGTLTLTGAPAVTLSGAHASDFSVSMQPAQTALAPSDSTTFQITFSPTSAGERVATVTIASSDSDRSPFEFAVSGNGDDSSLPTVSIIASDPSAVEPSNTGEFTVTLDLPAPAGGLVVAYTVSGTALPGTDYTALPGTVSLAAGATSATIPVSPLDDEVPEISKTVTLAIDPSPEYLRDPAETATVAIDDDDATSNAFVIEGDGTLSDLFGVGTSVDGGRVLIGARNDDTVVGHVGAAYLFDLSTRQIIHKFVPGDTGAPEFGRSVSLCGDLGMIGRFRDTELGASAGAAYLFDMTTGLQLHKLTAPDGEALDSLGLSVVLDGNRAIAGAHGDDDGADTAGAVYIFDAPSGAMLRKIISPDPDADDTFGFSVDAANGLLIVGAIGDDEAATDAGAAYLFYLDQSRPPVKLMAPAGDAATDDYFGQDVAIADNYVVVGAPHRSAGKGAAYVYDLDGQFVRKLAPDDGVNGNLFGFGLAASGPTLVVSAEGDPTLGASAGAAYLFDLETGQQLTKLLAPGGQPNDRFGRHPDIDGGVVVIGAEGVVKAGANAGAAYVFNFAGIQVRKDCALEVSEDGTSLTFEVWLNSEPSAAVTIPIVSSDTGEATASPASLTFDAQDWDVPQTVTITGVDDSAIDGVQSLEFLLGNAQSADESYSGLSRRLTVVNSDNDLRFVRKFAPDGANSDQFGLGLELDGDWAIIGSRLEEEGAVINAGAARLYNVETGQLIKRLATSNPTTSGQFGYYVSTENGISLVGATGEDGVQGAAYVFSNPSFVELHRLTASDGTPNDGFGSTGMLDGGRALIGAFLKDSAVATAGAAYLFDALTGQELRKFVSPTPGANDQFGLPTVLHDEVAIIGARLDDDLGTDTGAVFLFNADTGSLIRKLLPPNPGTAERFGTSAASDGEFLVVGAIQSNLTTDYGTGRAFVYRISTGELVHTLIPTDGEIGDFFGVSVEIHGNRIVVGAERHDSFGNDAGAVYMYDLETGEQLAKLGAPDAHDGMLFGRELSLDNHRLLVGAWNAFGGNISAGGAELLAYYNFNDNTNPGLVPASGGIAPDATLSGQAGYTTSAGGRSGAVGDRGLQLLPIVANTFARTPSGSHFDLAFATNAMSVSFWQKNFGNIGGGFPPTSSFWLDAPTAGSESRGFQAHVPWSDGTIFFDQSGCCTPSQRLTASGGIVENAWHHLVFQRDAGGNQEIWLDGTKVASASGAEPLDPFSGILTMGANSAGGNGLNGVIDEFAVYSGTLNPSKIAQLAAGTRVPTEIAPAPGFGLATGAAYLFELPALKITPTSGLATSELGGSQQLEISLSTRPTAPVEVAISVSDSTEATVSPATMTFTELDWNQPQELTVRGIDDSFFDGDVPYVVTFSTAGSSDPSYAQLATAEVEGKTSDDEGAMGTFLQKLSPAEGVNGDQFGFSGDLQGDQAIIGANLSDALGSNAGAAYHFDLVANRSSRLERAGVGIGDAAGHSVAVSGERIVVSRHGADSPGVDDHGAASLFATTSLSELLPELGRPGGPSPGTFFANTVAMSDQYIVFGSYIEGKVYAYNRSTETMVELPSGDDPLSLVGDNYAWDVAVDGNIAVVGGRRVDPAGVTDAGAAYIFDLDDLMKPSTRISASNSGVAGEATTSEFFGQSVAIHGNHIIVGAHQDNEPGTSDRYGAAHIFSLDRNTLATTYEGVLRPSDPVAGMDFGSDVDIRDGVAIVGTIMGDAVGRAYVYDVESRAELAVLQAPDGVPGDLFSSFVSLDSGRALIGARWGFGDTTRTGTAYLFDLPKIVVNSVADNTTSDGFTTLREAIILANNRPDGVATTIRFSGIEGQTILLNSALPNIEREITISASGRLGMTIQRPSGAPKFRLFSVGENGNLTLENLNLTGGDADTDDGGAIHNLGALTLRGCAIYGNEATNGGGIYNGVANSSPGSALLVNTTISGNTSQAPFGSGGGGGLFLADGSLNMTSCTIAWNFGSGLGDGLYLDAGTTNLQNCLIGENRSIQGVRFQPDVYVTGATLTSHGHNLVHSPFAGVASDLTNIDPQINPTLQSPGTATFHHALLPTSPAIDAGVAATLLTDQVGAPRTFDTTEPNEVGSDGADVGAIEFQPTLAVSVVGDGELQNGAPEPVEFGEAIVQTVDFPEKTIRLTNTGSDALELDLLNLPLPGGFEIVLINPPLAGGILAAGATVDLTLRLNSNTARGIKHGTVTITSNAASGAMFTFPVRGKVIGPEITLLGDADFGDLDQLVDPSPIARTFTIRNDGDATLNLTGVVAPSGFTVTQQPASLVLQQGEETTFALEMGNNPPGTRSGDVEIASNDFDESEFLLLVTGVVTGPELTVSGNGIEILSGSVADLANGTDFGNVPYLAPLPTRMFEIRNDGNAPLEIASLVIDPDFERISPLTLPPTLPAGSVLNLEVGLVANNNPALPEFTGTLVIANSDLDASEASFVLPLRAKVAHSVEVQGPDGGAIPSETAFNVEGEGDFGRIERGSTSAAARRTFTLQNRSTSVATVQVFSLPVGFSVVSPAGAVSMNPGDSVSLTIEIDTSSLGPKGAALPPAGMLPHERNLQIAVDVSGFLPFLQFEIGGTIIAPEIKVQRGGSHRVAFVGSYSDSTLDAAGQTISGLDGVRSISFSPMGEHLYAASQKQDDGVTVFGRDEVSGKLTWIETHPGPFITGSDDESFGLTVAPDGEHLYLSSVTANGMVAFDRITSTGQLTSSPIQQLSPLVGSQFSVISPGNSEFYSVGDDAIRIFRRTPATGTFTSTPADVVQNGVNSVVGLTAPRDLVASPDGAHLYAGTSTGIAVFGRNAGTGDLSFVEAVGGLARVNSVIVSPDGGFVFAAATNSHTVTIYARNATSGALTFHQSITDTEVSELQGVSSLAISEDGRRLFASSPESDSIAIFERDLNSGILSPTATDALLQDGGVDFAGKLIDGLRAGGNDQALALKISPDGRQLYAASHGDDGATTDNAIAVFDLDNVRGEIASGTATPSDADGTTFGTVVERSTGTLRSFTITNEDVAGGGSDLTIDSISVPSGFLLPDGSVTNLVIPKDGQFTFSVQLDTSLQPGVYSGDLVIISDDADEGSYHFAISGEVAPLAPIILMPLQDETRTSGETVQLEVEADGSESLNYEWRRNGQIIPGETSPLLTIFSADTADSGSYSVTVSNAAPQTATSTATVTVNPAPATVQITNLQQREVIGQPRHVTVTTDPPGLSVDVTYMVPGGATLPGAPTLRGDYSVTATITDPNYAGSKSETLVIKPLSFTAESDPVMDPDDVSSIDRGGTVSVSLQPLGIGAQWRFVGELFWRDPVNLPAPKVHGISPGTYEIEYRPVSGYITPASHDFATNTSLALNPNADFLFNQTYLVDPNPIATGSVKVDVSPSNLSPQSWRFDNEPGNWRDGGDEISRPAGDYVVIFEDVANQQAPSPRSVRVFAGQRSSISATYSAVPNLAGSYPSGIIESQLDDSPYSPNGQIQTEHGFASGIAIRDRVVLTAGHVVFDAETLSFVNRVQWFQQRHRHNDIPYEPAPEEPRGWYVFDGYAGEMGAVAQDPPGATSLATRELDVATLFFFQPDWRGGASGYLAASEAPNTWLTSNQAKKRLIGYPAEGVGTPISLGRMYATAELTNPFSRPNPVVAPSVYDISRDVIVGLPGMSGCGLYVETASGDWYPAAIYLGGTSSTIVREIDDDVVSLIDRAVLSSLDGEDHTGGGASSQQPRDTFDSFNGSGSLSVSFNIPDGRWRLDGDEIWRDGQHVLAMSATAQVVIEFEPVAGFATPLPKVVAVAPGQENSISVLYEDDSFTEWAQFEFTVPEQADPAISAAHADPDFDGIVNLLEMAFNLDPGLADGDLSPLNNGTSGLPETVVATGGSGEEYLAITFVRRKSGLDYEVQFSDDATAWSSNVFTVDVQSIDSEWERVTVRDVTPMSSSRRGFGRVLVTVP